MTTATEPKPKTIAELADYVANSYGRLGNKAMRDSWIAALASVAFDDALEAVEQWMRANDVKMPVPKNIRDSVNHNREKRQARVNSTAAIVCGWCGHVVAFEHNPWRCQAEQPKLDRTEARLRGLKNCNTTDERRRELDDYVNSKMAGRIVSQETF